MIPRPFFAQDDKNLRQIGWWLIFVAALVFAMILLGGATRLVNAGLSMVDWQPVSGTLPPLSAEDWQDEFEGYQEYPEYQQLNPDMTLGEFKGIFWWEYAHRLLGRLIGLAFALPLLFFVAKGMIPPHMKVRMFVLLSLGAAQGLLGWYMVQSGLGSEPAVSHLRLLAHLAVALGLLSALMWTAWQVLKAPVISWQEGRTLHLFLMFLTGMVGLQVAFGALTAGLDAGLIYNEWPGMGGGLIPGDLFATAPFYNDPTTVQFFHRLNAYLIFFLALVPAYHVKRYAKAACLGTLSLGLIHLVLAQVILGILTLIWFVPVSFGVAHQGLGIVLFLYCLYFVFALGGGRHA